MSHHPKISVIKNLTTSSPSDIVFIGIYKDKTLTPSGNDLSTDIKSGFDSAIKSGDVKGKTGELNFFYVDGRKYALVGLGSKSKINAEKIRIASGSAIRSAISKKAKTITLDCFCSEIDSCQPMGEGIALGGYEYNDLKTMDDKSFNISEIEVINANEDELNDGIVIGQAVCFARDLGNRPGNVATPTHLANAAKDISEAGDIDIRVFDREEFTEMGMGGLAGVAQGTDEPPKFIILEYNKGGEKRPKVLVGKGLTFDSGGISI